MIRPQLRALPRAFWRGWSVVAVGRLAQFVEPFLPVLLLLELDASTQAVAAVLLAAQLSATAGVAVAGAATDRLGARRVLRLGLALATLAAAGLAAAPGLPAAAAAAMVYGVAAASWRAAAQALVPAALADAASSQARASAFGLLVWASNLGAVISAAVGAAGAPVRAMIAAQAVMLLAAALLARILPAAGPSTPERLAPAAGVPMVLRARVRHVPDAGLWLVALAVAPATMLMFQAFSGLAVLLAPADYRLMVLANAVVLVAGQPIVAAAIRRIPAGIALAVAGVALALGLALHAWGAPVLVAVPLWTLAELVVIVVPSAVVAGLAPHHSAGSYVGGFQAVQGAVAAAATYLGPVTAAVSPTAFALAGLALAATGATALTALRRLVQTGLDQPVDCPCGAALCRCGGLDMTCVGPAPLIVHAARPRR